MMAACALLLIVSCKKVETPMSREDELRAGKWKMSVSTLKQNPYLGTVTTTDLLAALPGCKKDDYLVFKENYEASQNSSSSKCSSADPDEIMFRWELFDNGKTIHIWNATQTFFGLATYKTEFVNYSTDRFTLRRVVYQASPFDPAKFDTLAYTQTFVKY